MMQDEGKQVSMVKFIVLVSAAFLAIFTTSVIGCNIHRDYALSKAIEGGADPIEASMAFSYKRGTIETLIVKK